MAAKIRTQSTFSTTLTIDEIEIAVRVKRMTNTEFDAYEQGLARWGTPRGPEESDEAHQARVATGDAWVRSALNEYLQIMPDELAHDGREITKGGDLLDIYGGRLDVVPQALAVVAIENRLRESQKKTSRSLLASRLGFTSEPLETGTGDGPPAPTETTAADAGPSSSVRAAAVTAPDNEPSSGMTAPLSYEPVPSGR